MSLVEMLREVHKEVRVKRSTDLAVENVVYGRSLLQNPARAPSAQAVIDDIRPRVYKAKTNFERIKLMNEHYSEKEFIELLKSIDKVLMKHELLASKFKERAYLFYDERNYEMAMRCCNLALLFTPEDSDLFPKLYATRALFLNAIGDWKPVIKDIDMSLALADDFPRKLKDELLVMKDECLELRKNQTMDSETEKRQIYCDEFLFKVFGEANTKIPSTGNYITVVQHPVKGRTLVAKEDLSAGTTVIVEDPFSSILTGSTKWEVKHCARCYKKTGALVPCPKCIYTTYCSDRCRLEDYDYTHKYECPCLNYFHAIRIPPHMQMGFRALCKVGPEYMFQLFKETKKDQKSSSKEIKGFDPKTGRYDSDSYLQIHNLMTHTHGQLLEVHTWYCFTIAHLLNLKTKFFENIATESKGSFIEFISSCLLRNFLSFEHNTMELIEGDKSVKPKQDGKLGNQSSQEKVIESEDEQMIGVFSFASLLSHNCDPSALRINLANGKLAIITCRKLKAGEEVTISYGCEYSTHFLENRARILMRNFNFKCDCLPCVSKWPTLIDLPRNSFQYLCPNCSHQFTYEQKVMLKKCVLKIYRSKVGICDNCKENFDISIVKKELKKYGNILEKAHDLLITNKPVDAIPLLIKCLEFFQATVLLPFLPVVAAQSYLLNAYELITKSSRQ